MKNIIKITLASLVKVALVTIIYALFIVWTISLYANAEETPRQYEDYEIVKIGIEQDLKELEEDEVVSYVSVDKKEYPLEKVCIYNAKISTTDEGDFTALYYINGETEEVYAVLFDESGDVVDSEVMALSEAADLYR